MEKYLNENEVAKALHTCKRQISNYRKQGLLVGVKTGRLWVYKESDVEDFFDKFLGKAISGNNYKKF